MFKLRGHEEPAPGGASDCEHDFPPEMREMAYRMIDGVLGRK